MILARRSFLTGLASALAAPAIVKASSLMPVKAIRAPTEEEIYALLNERMNDVYRVTREAMARMIFGESFGEVRFFDNDKFQYKHIPNSELMILK